MIGLLDFGSAGNARSVANALNRAGADWKMVMRLSTRGTNGLSGLIIPGVGSFSVVPKITRALGGKSGVQNIKVPVLCICLGMQALFETSQECEGVRGLGVIPGKVKRIKGKVRLPQLGWNQVKQERKSALFYGIGDGEYFYFANSYAAFPSSRSDLLCTTRYGERFASAVSRGNWFGVQFHPEKSGAAGQRLLENFIGICKNGKSD